MKSQLMSVALLSSLVVVGCGDRSAQNDQNAPGTEAVTPATGLAASNQVSPPTAYSPVPQASSSADRQANRPNSQGARPTTGRRPAEDPRPPATDSTFIDEDRNGPPPRSSRTTSPAPAPREEWREISVPSGTAISLELMTPLASDTAQVEAPVSARIRQPVVVNGYTVMPSGTVLSGTVTDVERSGRVQGRARLAFTFNEMRINGNRENLRTNPVTFEAEQTKGEDATKIGVGAGAGAIIGGILGGKKGAAKGAVLGGGAGSGVVLATRGKEVELAAGTDITAVLADPLRLQVPIR